MSTSDKSSNQTTPKLRPAKRHIVMIALCAVLVLLFCPKKLSWLISIDNVIYCEYQTEFGEAFQRGADVEAFRAKAEDTWVIWTGWVHYIPGDCFTVYLFSEHTLMGYIQGLSGEASGILSIFGNALNNEHTLYLPWFGTALRYQCLNRTSKELIPDLWQD